VSDQREIVTGGIRLAYQVAGDPAAPPLVLLHALGENSADWAGVTGPLAASFREFALDLRGHGASDWPGARKTDARLLPASTGLQQPQSLLYSTAGDLIDPFLNGSFLRA
jgi:pimeloyl-ACP methyl ester carboxylesterase